MVVYIYNAITPLPEAERLQVQNQPGLHSEFKASLEYIVGP
jgi:hypothetical protein